MKTAYITGGTGCVGRNLVDELVKDNWEIIALVRSSSDLTRFEGCPLEIREVDFLNPKSIGRAMEEPAEAIFHVAGNVSHWPTRREQCRLWETNVDMTARLVESTLRSRVGRFIFTSTGATSTYDHLKTEEEILRIRSGYIKTKRLAERNVLEAIPRGLDAVILRPIIILGKYDYNNYSKLFSYLQKSRFKMSLPGELHFCHARDVARGHLLAYEKGRTGEIYYLGGEKTTWHDVLCRMSRLLRVTQPRKPFPLPVYYILSWFMLQLSYLTHREPELTPEFIDLITQNSGLTDEEFTRSEQELGYKSADLDSALQDCFDWLRCQISKDSNVESFIEAH